MRQKGLLSENDPKLPLRFAREMKRKVRQNPDFWTNEVAFFLDGVCFIHKYNLQSYGGVISDKVVSNCVIENL